MIFDKIVTLNVPNKKIMTNISHVVFVGKIVIDDSTKVLGVVSLISTSHRVVIGSWCLFFSRTLQHGSSPQPA